MLSLIDHVLVYLGFRSQVETLHPIASLFIALITLSIAYLLITPLVRFIRGTTFHPKGKHCFITGGSTGLGRSIAIELAKLGANVTIIARNAGKLDEAKHEIEAAKSCPEQKVIAISADVTRREEIVKAIEKATQSMNSVPEYIFTCAGAATPGLFMEQDLGSFERGMQLNYFGSLYTIHEAAQRMIRAGKKDCKIIMVSSILGLMGMVGYSQYAPTKHALRGVEQMRGAQGMKYARSLAECLRNELQLYGIKVHIYFPGTIFSPGFENEQKTKPEVTKIIEGVDSGLKPEDCAKAMIKGLLNNQFIITSDLIGDLFRCSMRGSAPHNNYVIDTIKMFIGNVIFPSWVWYADQVVRGEASKVRVGVGKVKKRE